MKLKIYFKPLELDIPDDNYKGLSKDEIIEYEKNNFDTEYFADFTEIDNVEFI